MRSLLLVVALVLLPSASRTPGVGDAGAEAVRVFVFAGQSNMEGADSRASEVDRVPPFAGLAEPQEDVRFWYVIGRETKRRSDGWEALAPVNALVGPELSFAAKVKERTGAPVAIVKVAAGGTHLGGDWNPDEPSGFELYPLLISTVREALGALEEEGVRYRLEGFVWHQGENDMFDDGYRAAYGANLTNFMKRVRRDLAAPGLRFYVGELCTKTIWGMDLRPRMADIARGQRAATDADGLAEYVPTSHVAVKIGGGVGLHYHYGTLGQLEHGVNHADAYLAHEGLGDTPREPLARWPLDEGVEVDLYVLAGHRNMEGERAFVEELRRAKGGKRLAGENPKVPFRYSLGGGVRVSRGWEALAPAGPYSTFGPELTFAETAARLSKRPFAIAKFTHGGSQIIDWTPEGSEAKARNLHPAFVDFVKDAVADLEGRGHGVRVTVVYHVGENDMSWGPFRRGAPERVAAFIAGTREALGRPGLRWCLSQQPPTDHPDVNGFDPVAPLAALAAGDDQVVHVLHADIPEQAEQLVLDTRGIMWLGDRLARAARD